MASTREIVSRMKSIKDTKKITSAMYMISSSKVKRAKTRLEEAQPYFDKLQLMIGRILRHLPEMESPYFDERTSIPKDHKKLGLLVISADKGLADAYNHNVFQMAQQEIDKNPETLLFVFGELGRQYFQKKGVPIAQNFHYTVQHPTMSRARSIAETMIDLFVSKQLDEIHIIYTSLVNPVTAQAMEVDLLPLKRVDFHGPAIAGVTLEEFALLPTPEAVIDSIVPNYLAGFIYGALVNSYCAEQNSRMIAMEGATKSADKMLRELSIIYNRIRQAAITQEISEVVGGAKALKRKRS